MRIEGITIPDDKHIVVGLTTIYGIGDSRAREILEAAKVDFDAKPESLSDSKQRDIRKAVENYTVEGDLRRQTEANIKRLKDIESYRGIRHKKNLPVRGQNTQTNSRTNRDYKGYKTAGSGKRTVEKK